MEQISLPTKINYQDGAKPNETILTIEPLYPGYGLTIGTAIRRVLLSSLGGGAVAAVKIKGVLHEFSTIPYVKEDVVDIILNLKKLRFRIHTDEEVRVTLHAKGEKEVTGADIASTNDVEVANPDLSICTLTNKNAQIEMELFVRRGRGYLPTEMRSKEKLELGTIAIDALFTPIRTVGLKVENVRVGQMTNYNKAILTIETDGSITAEAAVQEASKILVDHYALLAGGLGEIARGEDNQFVTSDELSSLVDSSGDQDVSLQEEGIQPKKRGRPKKGGAE
ncbi:DNA-directed RNA polymerase subunit alpha [Candidatus Uhrbacteria bacterium]|nr:DNA-directed RNA polymerase subunit alpha [Candidatus Uhrbacteria bacterium]